MKINSFTSVFFRSLLLRFILICPLLLFIYGCPENWKNELGVYTLCAYENNWKGNICVSPAYDPYYDFWDIMNCGSSSECAHSTSKRRLNSEVNPHTILPIPDDGWKDWNQFDFVFFYGHNNMIVPPHPHDWFSYSNYEGGTWVHKSGYLDDIGWGSTTNFDYYAIRPIDYADELPGALTYLYNEYTSSLLGGMYDYGGGGHFWRDHWYDTAQLLVYDQLGDNDLEWLILHGCQAVITANEDGSYNPLGLSAFHWVQGKFHIVLGHYKSYYTSDLQPLSGFAYDLKSGVPIQTAYFDVDPDNNTSAIASETSPFNWATSIMATDRWGNPGPDYSDTSIFSQRWIVPMGTVASHWD
jgi:hypothetical protein